MRYRLVAITTRALSESVRVSFGDLVAGPDLKIAITGDLYCPFKFINRAEKETLASAHDALYAWSLKHEFIQDLPVHREAFTRYNLVTFAAYTVVNIPSPDELHINPYQKLLNGTPIVDIVTDILDASTPLSEQSVLRQAKYLLWLFKHDNWVEKCNNHTLILNVHEQCLSALKTGRPRPILESKYKEIHSSLESSSEDFNFLNRLIISMADIGKEFNQAFHSLNFFESHKYIGFEDFCSSVQKYFEDQATEAFHRIMGTQISPDMARRIRKEACGVHTVNHAALTECHVPIPKEIESKSPIITRISEAFSYLICHFNDLISAPREIGHPNWSSNEISLLMIETEDLLSDRPISERFRHAVGQLFKKVNSDLRDAITDINILGNVEFEDETTINSHLIPLLTYVGVMQEWAIGSMPAQMALDRYSKHREGAYIKPGECLSGDSDFLRFIAKQN